MVSGQRHWQNGPGHGGPGPGHQQFDHDGGYGPAFVFDLPDVFKIDLENLNLKKFGKITDYDVSNNGLSLTLGKVWTFSVEGSDLEISLGGKSKMPVVTGGTIDSFAIDGPGHADFSISGLDMSATQFYQALINFNAAKLLDLVLGGDETISGSGFGDLLYGGDGNDTVLGNKGRDWLAGGNGDDRIVGGTANDYLEGNCGADTFAFAAHSGRDLVGDFDAGSDTIDLTAYGFEGDFYQFIEEHTYSERSPFGERCEDGGDVIIDLGEGNAIKLAGVSRWELNPDNVIL